MFLSAVHYLDTVMAATPSLKTSQLQLLASAALSIASKLHDPQPLSLYKLVICTDCSITVAELQMMELVVLEKLHWELVSQSTNREQAVSHCILQAAPTSLQLLAVLLARLEPRLCAKLAKLIHKQAETFLTLAGTEYQYSGVKPSVMVRTAQHSLLSY